MHQENILVWLPSPMGDAILATPALRAIRNCFSQAKITFLANRPVRDVLSPSSFNDQWLDQRKNNVLQTVKMLRKWRFTCAILFKNSFASALSVFLAGIPSRIGYAREGRSAFLTDRLYPAKLSNGRFKPVAMIDYYLAIASWLGGDVGERTIQLSVADESKVTLTKKFPDLFDSTKPIIVLVPGGAFGTSKCWLSDRFAKTADWLIDNYDAQIVVSVSPDPTEQQIADQICNLSRHKLVNLGRQPVTLGELKALFSVAELVITNDTGPRHIAIAFRRRVITLFGPNDPAWTQTGYENEIQIVGKAPCVPCRKPRCKQQQHLCMQSITVHMVCETAKALMENDREYAASMRSQRFVEITNSFYVDADFKPAFEQLGLDSLQAVFRFQGDEILTKENLGSYRSRLRFQTKLPKATLYLKRYEKPPLLLQTKNFLAHRTVASCAMLERETSRKLSGAGISTPRVIAYGQQMRHLSERRSFIITEQLADAESLEKKLPDYFHAGASAGNIKLRRRFITELAEFVKRFHETGFRHRDLYLCHIFHGKDGHFHLIDLARAFKPALLSQRYRAKDIAQLYYSAPAKYFSASDRLRFFLKYAKHRRLEQSDKEFVLKVLRKANRMAHHDKKQGRAAPFLELT